MPPSTVAALEQLGADLAVARLRRKEDRGAFELDVRAAEALGQARVRATTQAKMQRAALRLDK